MPILAHDQGCLCAHTLMVEEDAATSEHVVALTVVDRDPVTIDLRDTVGATWIEWGALPLWNFHYLPKHLTTAGLIKTDGRIHQAYCIEHTGHTECSRFTSENGLVPGGLDK